MGTKLDAGKATPKLAVALVGGGNAEIGGARDGYQLAIVYRGKHCPICQGYLNQLNKMQDAFRDANTELLVISADPPEKAQANRILPLLTSKDERLSLFGDQTGESSAEGR